MSRIKKACAILTSVAMTLGILLSFWLNTIPADADSTLLSQGCSATASSEETAQSNYAYKGNDGNTATRWAAGDSTYPQWWRVDLGENCSLEQVTISWYNGSDRAYKYRIEVSDDDSAYTTALDQTANTTTGNTTDNFTATGRYVKITVTGCSDGGAWASFSECCVYGSPQAEETPTPTPTNTPTPTSTPTPTPIPTPTPTPINIITNMVVSDANNAADWSVRYNIQVGDLEYGDRVYTIATLPEYFAGSDWIRAANDSKAYTGPTLVTFNVTQDADVYVAHTDELTTKPEWLSDWTDTGYDITDNESPSRVYSIYKKSYSVYEQIILGNNGGTSGMYTVIVKPAGEPVPTPTPTPTPSPTPTPTPYLYPDPTPTPVPGQDVSYYVSTEGSDNNPGTITQPFATISKARDVIRQTYPTSMPGNIYVYIRGGDYYLSSTLTFDSSDSGKSGYRIYYKNYPGETPYIHGGTLISGWTLDSGNIYKATLGSSDDFSTLYENGVRGYSARTPNDGYMIADAADTLSYSRFKFRNSDIPEVAHPEDLEAGIWPGGGDGEYNWFFWINGVSSVDYDTKAVSLETEMWYSIGTGSRYFIQGQKELLDQPGEFFLDKEANPRVLYYWPRSTPIASQKIIKPFAGDAIRFEGSSSTSLVSNITLEGLTIGDTHQDYDGIYMEYTQYIQFNKCRIQNTGMHGVHMYNWNQSNTISNCYIYDIGHTGVFIVGYNGGEVATLNDNSKNNTITNCEIYKVGTIIRHGAGIQFEQSGGNIVSYCRILDAPRYGISQKSVRPVKLLGQTVEGVLVTDSNLADFQHTRNNVFEFNDISDVNNDSQDTGMIESYGIGYDSGNIIRNNLLHDSDVPFSFGYGIYMDDASGGFTVFKNILCDLNKNGVGNLNNTIIMKGVGNVVSNNYVVDNNLLDADGSTPGGAIFGSQSLAGELNKNLWIEKNVTYSDETSVHDFANWTDDRYAYCDYNVHYNDTGVYTIRGNGPCSSWAGWLTVLDNKFDQHSVTANPQFMNISSNDFRLRYDSPAYNLGIEDINMHDIGLKSDFVFADQSEALAAIYVRKSADTEDKATIDLSVSGTAQLTVMGRTTSGYVADLSGAVISYESDSTGVATVDSSGLVTAQGTGTAKITVTANRSGIEISKDMYIRVN